MWAVVGRLRVSRSLMASVIAPLALWRKFTGLGRFAHLFENYLKVECCCKAVAMAADVRLDKLGQLLASKV